MTKPYYQDKWAIQYCSNALDVLPELESESIDLLLTDPPYGIGFMGKDWDKALPDKRIWTECLRVLKPGAFAFVMSIPRADCLSRMIISLEDAGFRVDFTPIYWAYGSGFPKTQNIGKAVDKQECRKQLTEELGRKPTKEEFDKAWKRFREKTRKRVIGYKDKNRSVLQPQDGWNANSMKSEFYETAPTTPQAKVLDGSYGGFQPKPAVEVIIVAMKPLSEKTFVDQALKNGKGISWLDEGRIPTNWEEYPDSWKQSGHRATPTNSSFGCGGTGIKTNQGRFPANLLVSDDVLNDGKVHISGQLLTHHKRNANSFLGTNTFKIRERTGEPANWGGDSGSFSRYFDLDKWAQKTFPFLIVPKASKSEKNRGCEGLPEKIGGGMQGTADLSLKTGSGNIRNNKARNNHPTVKPLKLMSYLVTLGSREGDVVLDPFLGSGTTMLACQMLNRKCVGIEVNEKYCEIAAKRCSSQEVMDFRSVDYREVSNE